jgi:hypothetical protein
MNMKPSAWSRVGDFIERTLNLTASHSDGKFVVIAEDGDQFCYTTMGVPTGILPAQLRRWADELEKL